MSDSSTGKQYRIETLADLLAVATPENVAVLAQDIATWLVYNVGAREVAPTIEIMPYLLWNDDGDPGIREVRFTFKRKAAK